MLLRVLQEVGTKEVEGEDQSNERILEYSRVAGLPRSQDEIPWCGIFMAWSAIRSGYEVPDEANWARSWLKVGDEVDKPLPGDLVIFWRRELESRFGHVGLFCSYNKTKSRIWVLGGNQDDKVGIKSYPVRRLLGFRRPRILL